MNIVVEDTDANVDVALKISSNEDELKLQVERLQQCLEDQLEINAELTKSKMELSSEIMELTKALFEEANGMVAAEIRARSKLESEQGRLLFELNNTRELLMLEAQQLGELRSRIHLRSNSNTLSGTSNHAEFAEKGSHALAVPSLSYFEDLLPSRRFELRDRQAGPNGERWEQLVDCIDPEEYTAFGKFVDRCGELDDSAVLEHPLMKRIFDQDVLPCLQFDFKPKPFVKRLVQAMLLNTCTIERLAIEASLTGASTERTGSPVSVAGYGPSSNATEEMMRVRGVLNQFTMSVSSLPEMFIGPDERKGDARFCVLCGRAPIDQQKDSEIQVNSLSFRFRLSDNEPWMAIDTICRERLVASGHFYAFVRHLRRGLYTCRPIADLFFELQHYKRSLFYARCGLFATPLFIQSDYEAFLKLIKRGAPEEADVPLSALENVISVIEAYSASSEGSDSQESEIEEAESLMII